MALLAALVRAHDRGRSLTAPTARARPLRRAATGNGLSQAKIVAAARELLAEFGVEGLSIKRLSTRLGVSMGAMYHHVEDKDMLIGRVAEQIYAEIDDDPSTAGDWVEQCREQMRRFYVEMRRYPGLTAYVMTHIRESGPMALGDRLHKVLASAGLDHVQATLVMTTLFFYGSGALLSEPMLATAGKLSARRQLELYTTGLDRVLEGIRASVEG